MDLCWLEEQILDYADITRLPSRHFNIIALGDVDAILNSFKWSFSTSTDSFAMSTDSSFSSSTDSSFSTQGIDVPLKYSFVSLQEYVNVHLWVTRHFHIARLILEKFSDDLIYCKLVVLSSDNTFLTHARKRLDGCEKVEFALVKDQDDICEFLCEFFEGFSSPEMMPCVESNGSLEDENGSVEKNDSVEDENGSVDIANDHLEEPVDNHITYQNMLEKLYGDFAFYSSP